MRKIISQIVRVSEVCDQNGDRVSKNHKICHICSMRLKRTLNNNLNNIGPCLFMNSPKAGT